MKYLLPLALIFLLPLFAHAQAAGREGKLPDPASPKQTEKFSVTWTSVPQGFTGPNTVEVFNKLANSKKFAQIRFAGGYDLNNILPLVYVAQNDRDPILSASYDTDAGYLSAGISLRRLRGGPPAARKYSLAIDLGPWPNGYYRFFESRLIVVISNPDEFPFDAQCCRLGQRLKLDRDAAKDAKNNLAVLYVLKPLAPYFADDEEDTITGQITPYLYARLQEVWFYNKRTGEIYKKLAAQPTAQKPA